MIEPSDGANAWILLFSEGSDSPSERFLLLPDSVFGVTVSFLLVSANADGATKRFLIVSDPLVDINEKM